VISERKLGSDICLSNFNGFAFFIWQKIEFANFQINIGEEKKSYLQQFGKIDLPKSKKGNPAA
jgi:hypothetical protein